jgi:hypothetical protein
MALAGPHSASWPREICLASRPNRRIIGTFCARTIVLDTAEASPLWAPRLPKHARCQATLRPDGFVLTTRMYCGWPSFVTRLHRSSPRPQDDSCQMS